MSQHKAAGLRTMGSSRAEIISQRLHVDYIIGQFKVPAFINPVEVACSASSQTIRSTSVESHQVGHIYLCLYCECQHVPILEWRKYSFILALDAHIRFYTVILGVLVNTCKTPGFSAMSQSCSLLLFALRMGQCFLDGQYQRI